MDLKLKPQASLKNLPTQPDCSTQQRMNQVFPPRVMSLETVLAHVVQARNISDAMVVLKVI
jgi:hypothetical protein